jgi:hypothetical protein
MHGGSETSGPFPSLDLITITRSRWWWQVRGVSEGSGLGLVDGAFVAVVGDVDVAEGGQDEGVVDADVVG